MFKKSMSWFARCLAFTVFFSSVASFGAISEFNYQAQEGESYVESNFGYTSFELDGIFLGSRASVEIEDMSLDIKYEKGLTENVAWYVMTGYADGELEAVDAKGMLPLSTGLKIQSINDTGRFISSINLSHELESAKDDNRTGSVMTFSLGMGYEHTLNKTSLFGYSASYAFFSTDFQRKDSNDVAKTKGAVNANVYYERHSGNLIYGASIGYHLSGIANLTNYSVETDDAVGNEFGHASLKTYGRFDLSEKLSLRGSVSYKTVVHTSSDLDAGDGFGASLGARFKF